MSDKNINDMTREEFGRLKRLDWGEQTPEYDSLIIIPHPKSDLHKSGYRCMSYVLARDGKALGLVGGGSDFVHIDGIGGWALKSEFYKRHPEFAKPISDRPPAWSIDCLPRSGYLRLFCGQLLWNNPFGSSFEVMSTNKAYAMLKERAKNAEE